MRQTIDENGTASEDIFTKKKQDPVTVNQNLSFYYTASEKNIFAFEMQHTYQDENPFYNADLASDPFVSPLGNVLGYDDSQVRTNLNQDRFVKTNKLDAKLDYYYMLTPKSNINVTLGNSNSNQSFDH